MDEPSLEDFRAIARRALVAGLQGVTISNPAQVAELLAAIDSLPVRFPLFDRWLAGHVGALNCWCLAVPSVERRVGRNRRKAIFSPHPLLDALEQLQSGISLEQVHLPEDPPEWRQVEDALAVAHRERWRIWMCQSI